MGDRPTVLLTVSGVIPEQLDADVAAGRRPRADYRVLAERLDADVVDVALAVADGGRIAGLMYRLLGPGPTLAWYVFRHRRRYQLVLTDGEQVGLPLALLTRLFGRGGLRHVMIVHILTTRSKSLMTRWCRLQRQIDRYLVYASRQAELMADRLAVDPKRITLIPFMVDTRFFRPTGSADRTRPMICSAGLERRDYPTLLAAVDGLDVDVVVAAASPWSTQPDTTAGQRTPSNVTVERLDLFELRRRYDGCRFVVMPLLDVDFQAGITTILEAMSMERAVICTLTPGQTDTIVDGETGRYVPVGDVAALRRAIQELLDDDAEAQRLGRAARDWVVAHAELDRYTDLIADVVDSVRDRS